MCQIAYSRIAELSTENIIDEFNDSYHLERENIFTLKDCQWLKTNTQEIQQQNSLKTDSTAE